LHNFGITLNISENLVFLEYILVTPSQHRVHHAINPIYIDKNLAAIFCVWDRLFGTFQEELDSEPPVYGTLKASKSWNPFGSIFNIFGNSQRCMVCKKGNRQT